MSFSLLANVLFLVRSSTLKSLVYFLGGSEGLFAQKTLEISDEILSTYKNQGKSHM